MAEATSTPSAPADESRTLTVPEAGKLLGIGKYAAYGAVKRGEIPALKFGRKLLVTRHVVEQLLQGQKIPNPEA